MTPPPSGNNGRFDPPAIDLTYPLTPGMPVYPGSPEPEIRTLASYGRDGFREQLLSLCSHTGTHMDAPRHLLAEGKALDQFPIDHFMGTGLCIDASETPDGSIPWSLLQPHEDDLAASDFLVLHTGWGRHWRTPRYFKDFPVLTVEAARRLARMNLKGIGVDAISVDLADTTDYPVHRTLLENDLLIIENLAGLDRLPRGRFGRLVCLPLLLADADGAPARVAALIATENGGF
jgi:kynurenine formamidase